MKVAVAPPGSRVALSPMILFTVACLVHPSPLEGRTSISGDSTTSAPLVEHDETQLALHQKVVRVGIFLSQIKNLSLQDNQFEFDAYLWFRWNPADSITFYGEEEQLRPHETFELLGASNVDTRLLLERPGYAVLRIHGELSQYWDVSEFPFDEHRIQLGIEDSAREIDEIRFEPDLEESVISPIVQIPGWVIHPLKVYDTTWEYATTFGDPELDSGDHSFFSRITFEITMERQWPTMIVKAFAGLMIAVLVALVPHFIDPREVDPRFGLSVGGLFAGVANQYVVSDSLPPTAGWTVSDKIHMISLLVILGAIVRSAFALRSVKTGGDRALPREEVLDRRWFLGLVCFWIVGVLAVGISGFD